MTQVHVSRVRVTSCSILGYLVDVAFYFLLLFEKIFTIYHNKKKLPIVIEMFETTVYLLLSMFNKIPYKLLFPIIDLYYSEMLLRDI